MLSIYQRLKNDAGKWRYTPVEEGRGIKTGTLQPPFYVRVTIDSKQQWHRLAAENYEAAKVESSRAGHALEAERKGLTVAEAETVTNRVPLGPAVEHFLELMAGHAPRTLSQYRLSLEQFAALAGVRFVDEVTVPVLRRYKLALHKEGYAGKTSLTRLNIVRSLLKKYKNDAKLEKNEKPRPVKNSPDPYSEEDLAKLFGAMDAAERIRFRFFLGSACREQEVQFAEWSDLNLTAKTYIVREKNDVGFAPKNRQSRTVPLPTNLCEDLKEWKKKSDGSRWVFPSKHGLPDGHLLRKLKSIAERAGLDPEKCYLHRFRKTCATRWSDNGTSVRKIQIWLGHESLEVTQKYLGEGSNVNERENIDNAFGD